MTATERHKHNHSLLSRVYLPMRPKIEAILTDLESHDWQPQIDALVWRSPAEQLAKYRAGYSRLKWGLHNASNRDGSAASLAADIVDTRHLWQPPLVYWFHLARSARAHGLDTGILWGLTTKERAVVNHALQSRNDSPGRIRIGWDPAHVQPPNISITAARLGFRPKLS
jgi:hypothetical protein